MKVLSLSCIALAVANDDSYNRTLLNSRRLAGGRRLAQAKCEIEVWPQALGKVSPFNAATATRGCTTALPAVFAAASTVTGSGGTADDGADSAIQTDCCKAAPLCSTSYVDNGASATDKIAACATASNKVPASLYCRTTDNAGKCASAAPTTHTSDVDKAHCCRQMCNDASGGFQLNAGTSTTLKKCPVAGTGTGITYQVSQTAHCASQACVEATDQTACCQKKCTDGFLLDGITKVTANGNDQNCAAGADRVSPTAYCVGSNCAASDAGACCQNKCSDGYELFGGTTTGKRQCATGLRVSPDAYCSGPTCASTDDATCCETKCDKAAAGYELHGRSTTGMSQCAKDLRVAPTEYCDGTACASSSGVCCQQKCTAGFKLKGATGTGAECGTDLTVHATAYCKESSCTVASDAGTCCQQKCSKGYKVFGATTKESNTCVKDTTLASDAKCTGSPCADADTKICCNEKCTHKTTGFKVKGSSGKEANECKSGEIVSTKDECKGDCSSDDASTCCKKANKTATTDAKSSGLASLVAGLVLMAAAAAA
jgi:hypothetical protein